MHQRDEVHELGQIEATEILHGDNPTDLHFRYSRSFHVSSGIPSSAEP